MQKLEIILLIKESFLKHILKFVLEVYFNCEVHLTTDEQDVLNTLKEKDHRFDFLIYEYDPFSNFVGELRKIKGKKNFQSFVVADVEYEQNIAAFENDTAIKLIKKNDIPLALIQQISTLNGTQEILNKSPYCRIGINMLVRFDGIKKNLFIKIGPERMIQIFKEDDKTELEDIMKYHSRGVEHLFLKRSTAETVTTQIQRQIKIYLKSNNFKFMLRNASDTPESLYEQRIIRIHQEVYIDDEFQKIIQEAIGKMKSKIMKEKRIDLFLSYLMNMPNYFAFFSRKLELTSAFTIMICEKLKWYSKVTNEKIIYAAVLSDITLATRPKLLQIRDIEEFTLSLPDLSQEDKEFFLGHPQECANLANKFFNSAPPETGTIILQHHELPDGSGFPGGLKADKISPLSAAVIIANDFAHYVLSNESPSVDEYLSENEQRWDYTNFKKPFAALREIRDDKLKYLKK